MYCFNLLSFGYIYIFKAAFAGSYFIGCILQWILDFGINKMEDKKENMDEKQENETNDNENEPLNDEIE